MITSLQGANSSQTGQGERGDKMHKVKLWENFFQPDLGHLDDDGISSLNITISNLKYNLDHLFYYIVLIFHLAWATQDLFLFVFCLGRLISNFSSPKENREIQGLKIMSDTTLNDPKRTFYENVKDLIRTAYNIHVVQKTDDDGNDLNLLKTNMVGQISSLILCAILTQFRL